MIAATLAATIFHAPPASAKPYQAPKVQKERMVGGKSAAPIKTAPGPTGKPFAPPAPVWPGAADVEVALPSAGARMAGMGGPAAVPGLPVSVDPAGSTSEAPTTIRVKSFDRAATAAASVDGLLLAVSRADGASRAGSARVVVDYKSFRWAYGGDWASRLRLKVLPACGLISPAAPDCAAHDVASTNDARAGTLTGYVDLQATGETLLAVTAGSESPSGDYKATSLTPAGVWSAEGNAGDFSWTYDLRVPPSLGGPMPGIELAYSSASVDGRMVAANNQPSWIGEGFDWSPGYIERRYTTCAEDMGNGANNTTKTADLCWDTDNATILLGSRAGELLKDGSTANRWHLRNDDGTYIERRTGASNGAKDGEWWVATTTDGTEYWFGGRSGVNSTLTVPVYGNHKDEPCNTTTFAASRCVNMPWRWQLDHVVDRHGNTMNLFYKKETNKYGRNDSSTDLDDYDRDGYLEKIEYGTRTGSTGSAPMQVLFGVSDRCLSGCTTKDGVHWPDTPWDQECTKSPCYSSAPTFWTTKRLTSIKTRIWDAAANDYKDVESWGFSHSFPDPVDSQPGALWLDRISHDGLLTTPATTVPDITFVGVAMPNRVDTLNDQYPAMKRFRMKTINSETGGKLDVSYTDPDCVAKSRIPDKDNLHANTLRCYPVIWTPAGVTNPITDFFHKYLVTDVAEADLSGASTRALTHYDYLGDPAWHYTDDDGLIGKKYKTWSVWRGYEFVQVTKGDPGEQTRTKTRYFRGMHGDKLPSGTRSVTMPAISTGNIPAVNDEDAYAGMVREEITYNGSGGAEVSATVNEPWQSAATASRTINGFTAHARYTGTAAEHTRTTLDGGRAPRTTTKRTTFDGYGMPTRVDDAGDNAVTDDQGCTLTDYIRDTSPEVWIIDTVSREREYAVDCARAAQTGLTEDDIISDEKTSYDQQAWNVKPTRGLVSKVEEIKEWNGGSPTYVTTSRATHDANGRVFESWDIRGGKTTTTYTPATGGPVTSTTVTNPLGWTETTVMEPAWQVPLSTTDSNARVIGYSYDGLGRLRNVWLPGRDKATQTPTISYDYLVRNNAPTVVTNRRLNPAGEYVTSYVFYDNLLRQRQTQEPDGAGGPSTMVTDTYYDSAGREFKVHEPYLACKRISPTQCDPVAPSTNLFNPTDVIPRQTLTLFDGVGREIAEILQKDAAPASPGGTEKWRTTTAYGGDRTDVTPPEGGTATSTFTDADGQVTEKRQYHKGFAAGSTDPAGYEATTYAYDRKGQLTTINGPGGNVWRYDYDLRGRQTEVQDPDKGTITSTYSDAGDVLTSTDDNDVTVAYTYDLLGRKTSVRDGSETGAIRAKWEYDTLANDVVVNGELVRSTRYVGTDAYVKEHTAFTVDYRPSSTKYVIPASETGLAGTYTYVYTYNQDGSPATTRYPAAGDLAVETLTAGYNAQGKPTTLSTGSTFGNTYVTGTDYTSFNEIGAIHLRNNAGYLVDVTRTYETDTRRLAQIWTTRQVTPTNVADVRFDYDPAGNVSRVRDLTSGDNQCFRTDGLRRITEAWTPLNGDCGPAPTVAGLGGPSRYWHSYSYDKSGSRRQLVEHGTATGDRTTDYTMFPGTHRLSGTSARDNTGTKTASYTYDEAGNTRTRPTATAGTQTLTWDPEGHLATSQDSTGTTEYTYDAEGNRLIRDDPTGKTLYLPGQELRFNRGTSAKTCTRYYNHTDQTVAMRTAAGVTWLVDDHHGTAQVSINAVNQSVATRRETPFGGQRGSTGTWPAAMDKGFVGGTKDNTGLTHLGAREYDPLIGRFISVDPIIDENDPQQLNGYVYSNNGPLTFSDPDGQLFGWAKKAASAVAHHVYNNAGRYAAALTVASALCTVIPGAQVALPVLGAAAFAMSAIDTYKSCSEGDAVDCGVGIAGMVPVAGSAFKTSKNLYKAGKRLDKALSKKNDFDFTTRGGYNTGKQRKAINKELARARRDLARQQRNAKPLWGKGRGTILDDGRTFKRWRSIADGENVAWETCKLSFGCGSRHQALGWNAWWNKNYGLNGRKVRKATSRSYSFYLYRKQMEQF